MKNLSTKLLGLLLVGVMLFSITSCSLLDSLLGGENPPPSTEEDPPVTDGGSDSGNTEVPPAKTNFNITFHYGFAEDATFDETGKASAYTESKSYESKNGRKINLTTTMKNAFAVENYKIIGYSTTAWQKDGISEDMDVYVLYAPLAECTITFQNPDGSVIKTLAKKENDALTAEEYPAASEVVIEAGYEFVGWDITSIDVITESVVIKAVQGTTLKLEAEKSNHYFIDDPENTAGKVIVSTVGSGGKSVYCAQGAVIIEFTITVDEDVDLFWGAGMWHREGADNASIARYFTYSVKAAGEDNYTNVTATGTLTCSTDWGDFQPVEIGKISLKKGANLLKIEGNPYLNLDYITLKGNVDGVHMNPYNLTLNGATFKNGKTTMQVEAGSTLPTGLIINAPEGQILSGWTDGTNTWRSNEFIMPEQDVTLTAIFNDLQQSKNVAAVDEIAIDGVRDASYSRVDDMLPNVLRGSEDQLKTIKAKVYMAAKDNGIYVFIDTWDNTVVSVGKEKAEAGEWSNDAIEFWFQYNGVISKIKIDAFGYAKYTANDGHAVAFANIDKVQFATTLKNDDNLAQYKAAGTEVVSETANGYTVEFWLPLAEEGQSVVGTELVWALHMNNAITTTDNAPGMVGFKLKEDYEITALDCIYKAKFVNSMRIEAEDPNSAVYKNNGATIAPVVITDKSNLGKASGDAYLDCNFNGGSTVTYEITASKATTLNLILAAAHRDTTLKAINDYITVYVNDTKIDIDTLTAFSIDGWDQDSNGDGKKGEYYNFEEIDLGNIELNSGTNTVRIEVKNVRFELDYLEFVGETEGVAQVKNA